MLLLKSLIWVFSQNENNKHNFTIDINTVKHSKIQAKIVEDHPAMEPKKLKKLDK